MNLIERNQEQISIERKSNVITFKNGEGRVEILPKRLIPPMSIPRPQEMPIRSLAAFHGDIYCCKLNKEILNIDKPVQIICEIKNIDEFQLLNMLLIELQWANFIIGKISGTIECNLENKSGGGK